MWTAVASPGRDSSLAYLKENVSSAWRLRCVSAFTAALFFCQPAHLQGMAAKKLSESLHEATTPAWLL
jgi:hypothetical protein